MQWTVKHKYVVSDKLKYGDLRIKKRFCLFPKSSYNSKTNSTTYYWLESVYVAYEWIEGSTLEFDFTGIPVCEQDHWKRIGFATTYENATKRIWR